MADNSLPFNSTQCQPVSDQDDWKPIPGFEGRYEVSRLGRVRSLVTNRILAPAPNSKGYLCVSLFDGSRPKKPRSFLLHRLVAAAFVGDLVEGMQSNHIDGNKLNCRADNLEVISAQENRDHARANGLTPRLYRGQDNSNAKLTNNDVKMIKVMLAMGATNAMVGRAFRIDPAWVLQIKRGAAWSHVLAPKIIFE